MYKLQISYMDGNTKKTRHADMENSVAKYFDVNGYICYDLLEPAVRNLAATLKTPKKDN